MEKAKGKIECPSCASESISNRKTYFIDKTRDPNDIYIPVSTIYNLIPKEEFTKLEELWTNKSESYINCSGFLKRSLDHNGNPEKIPKDLLKNYLLGRTKDLGFDIQPCVAKFANDFWTSSIICYGCGIKFCTKCKNYDHTG